MSKTDFAYLESEKTVLAEAKAAGKHLAGMGKPSSSLFLVWSSMHKVFAVDPNGRYFKIKHKVRKAFMAGYMQSRLPAILGGKSE